MRHNLTGSELVEPHPDPAAPVTRFRGDNFVPDEEDGGEAPPTSRADFGSLLIPESESLAAWLTAWLDGSLKF